MQDWKQVKEALSIACKVNIFTHVHADGDCLGSAFALAYFLCNFGKTVNIICEEAPPKNLSFIYDVNLPQNIRFVILCQCDETAQAELTADISVAVDVSDAKRLGECNEMFFKAPVTMRIDHHISYESFTDITICNTLWSATAEGIWELLKTCENWEGFTNITEIAKNVYAGILTDTGCFAYSNVTAQTHFIASEILQIAGSMAWQYAAVYENQSKSEVALKALAYSKIEYYLNGKISFLHILKEDMIKTNANDDHLGSLAAFMRCIEGVNVGILVKPGKVENQYRISLRSDEHCDVNKVAAFFGGGGHKRASGLVFTAEGSKSFDEFKENLIGEVQKWME